MTDRYAERLSEYVDGELAADERAELERHLANCGSCRQELEDLRGLVARLDSMPPGGPARDLWPELRRSIDASPRRARVPGRWTLGAAAALIAAALLSLWWMTGRPGSSVPSQDPASRADLVTAGRAALDPYREMVEQWRGVVDVEQLPEPLATSLRADLAAYDEAVREGLQTLDQTPDDAELTVYLIRTLQAQARLLERARQAQEML